jgi:chitin disaccharide deacetylase
MARRSRLIVQADDVAITHGATLGTMDSITQGVVRNAGLFTNRPDSEYAARQLLACEGIDVGIDINLVTGSPLLPAQQVTTLVDEHGVFHSSRSIRATNSVKRQDGMYTYFNTDPFDPDEALAEARAQVLRFVELMHRPPAYVHHHSLVSEVTDAVLHQIAEEFSLLLIDDLHRFGTVPMLQTPWYRDTSTLDAQAGGDALGAVESVVQAAAAGDLSMLIIHPGYIDGELFDITSLSLTRARDAEFAMAPALARGLHEAGVELVTYSEVAGELVVAR